MADARPVVWSKAALLDLRGIIDCVFAREGIDTAARIHERLVRRIESLSTLGERGRVIPELRALGVTDYRESIASPWRICYRPYEREIAVVAVLDGRRDIGEILVDRALRG